MYPTSNLVSPRASTYDCTPQKKIPSKVQYTSSYWRGELSSRKIVLKDGSVTDVKIKSCCFCCIDVKAESRAQTEGTDAFFAHLKDTFGVLPSLAARHVHGSDTEFGYLRLDRALDALRYAQSFLASQKNIMKIAMHIKFYSFYVISQVKTPSPVRDSASLDSLCAVARESSSASVTTSSTVTVMHVSTASSAETGMPASRDQSFESVATVASRPSSAVTIHHLSSASSTEMTMPSSKVPSLESVTTTSSGPSAVVKVRSYSSAASMEMGRPIVRDQSSDSVRSPKPKPTLEVINDDNLREPYRPEKVKRTFTLISTNVRLEGNSLETAVSMTTQRLFALGEYSVNKKQVMTAILHTFEELRITLQPPSAKLPDPMVDAIRENPFASLAGPVLSQLYLVAPKS